jgi:hypothetical protein
MGPLQKCLFLLLLAVSLASTAADARHRRQHHHGGSSPSSFGMLTRPEFAGPAGWSTFVTANGGTAVDYPANVFSVKQEPPDGKDGTLFQTADGRAKLTVYSLANEERETPRSYIERHLLVSQGQLTYKRIAREFFAVSGTRDEATFYSRCNFEDVNGRMHCIYLEYPNAEERAWDRIVTRISRSLRGPMLKEAR